MRVELLGTDGGMEPVILIAFRKPWGVYLSVRGSLRRGRRMRLGVGPKFNGFYFRRLR